MADLSSKARGNLAADDFAVPGKRKLPINDADHVRAAMARLNQTEGLTDSEKTTAKARIRAAAKKFGIQISDDSPMAAEFAPVLMVDAGDIQILAEGSDENTGVMRLRVPWYVGNSVARIAGFSKKVYFPDGILAETAAKASRVMEAKAPGLTSYARHAHAMTKDQVPAGEVVALEHDGHKGFAVIDVNSTRWGQDIQALARAKQLRATSLRSPTGGWQGVERNINGESMLKLTSLDLEGIDFAPDGAAMPTYGVEVLAAEAADEPAPTQVPRRTHSMDDITVDGLRAESPQVVKDIEAPLKARITELEQKVDAQIAAEKVRERDALIAEIAAKFPDPDAALPELQKLCAEATSRDEVAALAMPLLLENLTAVKAEPAKSPEDKLRAMFPGSGAGQTIQAEAHVETETIDGFAVPSN